MTHALMHIELTTIRFVELKLYVLFFIFHVFLSLATMKSRLVFCMLVYDSVHLGCF